MEKNMKKNVCVCVYIYIYVHICVCVCVCESLCRIVETSNNVNQLFFNKIN